MTSARYCERPTQSVYTVSSAHKKQELVFLFSSYIKLISVLAHTMRCHESTAVGLYCVYWDKILKWDEGWRQLVVRTIHYWYFISLLTLTLEYSLQQSSAESDPWWRSRGNEWCSKGEPQLENTEVSNSLGSHDLSWINYCTLNAQSIVKNYSLETCTM